MTVPQEPHQPAAAYTVMAELLDEGYFVRQPPREGALLQVVGSDSISTQWAMDVRLAQSLLEPLRADDRIVRVIPSRYTTTAAA